jgi:hypothetical protein
MSSKYACDILKLQSGYTHENSLHQVQKIAGAIPLLIWQQFQDRAIAQALSQRPLTAEERAQS